MRQGGDPRLPLELALVKVTRPGAGSLRGVHRLPARTARGSVPLSGRVPGTVPVRDSLHRLRPEPGRGAGGAEEDPEGRRPSSSGQLQEAWLRTVVPAVGAALDPDGLDAARSAPIGSGRRPPDAGVPRERGLPPATRRGQEERRPARRRAVRGHRAAAPARVCARGVNGEDPVEEEPPARRTSSL